MSRRTVYEALRVPTGKQPALSAALAATLSAAHLPDDGQADRLAATGIRTFNRLLRRELALQPDGLTDDERRTGVAPLYQAQRTALRRLIPALLATPATAGQE